jgi:acyl-CoA synthetase (AMP-forming)/AMP-acid ligase II
MHATMMRTPLLLNSLLDRAGRMFRTSEIVSRLPDKSMRRHTDVQWHERTRRLAAALLAAGLKPGERVATLCWNHHAHLEAYSGIPAAGGVMHPLNLRLAPVARRAMAGVLVPLVDLRIVGDGGEQPWDGDSVGEIQVRGPFITGGYPAVGADPDTFTGDGWLRTGDVGAMDAHGYLRISDRTKDLIKSGGEWISSVDLENAIMAHPAVTEAAVIAVAHPKWAERPLACVVLKPGASEDAAQLRAHLSGAFATWQVPDAFEFIDAIPRTSTGEFWKARLRERFAGDVLPE